MTTAVSYRDREAARGLFGVREQIFPYPMSCNNGLGSAPAIFGMAGSTGFGGRVCCHFHPPRRPGLLSFHPLLAFPPSSSCPEQPWLPAKKPYHLVLQLYSNPLPTGAGLSTSPVSLPPEPEYLMAHFATLGASGKCRGLAAAH